jgi:hypothetical protein
MVYTVCSTIESKKVRLLAVSCYLVFAAAVVEVEDTVRDDVLALLLTPLLPLLPLLAAVVLDVVVLLPPPTAELSSSHSNFFSASNESAWSCMHQ